MNARACFSALFLSLSVAGCAATPSAEPQMPMAAQAPAPVPVLTQSVFSKDANGSLSENDLQKVMEAALDIQLPARIGVVPLASPYDPKGTVAIQVRSAASRSLARALSGDVHFSHVSDVSTELPNVGGLEGLRAIAARYRLRYLLLYSERFEDETHVNGWAWLYPTVIGMFVAPGVTVKSRGIAQVDLLDVRTGTILFSGVQPMRVSDEQQMIGAARAHRELQEQASNEAAKALSKLVKAQMIELVAASDELGKSHRMTRYLPPPVEPVIPYSPPAPAAAPPKAISQAE